MGNSPTTAEEGLPDEGKKNFEEGMKNLAKMFEIMSGKLQPKKTPMQHLQEWAPWIVVVVIILILLYKIYRDNLRKSSSTSYSVSATSTQSVDERLEQARVRQQAILAEKAREAAELKQRKLAEETLRKEQQLGLNAASSHQDTNASRSTAGATPASKPSASAIPSRRPPVTSGGGFSHFGGSGGSNFKPSGFSRPRGGG